VITRQPRPIIPSAGKEARGRLRGGTLSREAEPRKKSTEIMYTILALQRYLETLQSFRVPSAKLEEYLEILTGLGLLEEDGGRYRITEKGERFLRESEDLSNPID